MLQTIADDWVLIAPESIEREIRSSGGIVIPNAFENVSIAVVVKIGTAKPFSGTDIRPAPPAAEGDRILFQDLRAIPTHSVTFENKQYRLIRFHDVLGVITPASQAGEEGVAENMGKGEPL